MTFPICACEIVSPAGTVTRQRYGCSYARIVGNTSHQTAPAAMMIGTTSRENKNVFFAHAMVISRVKATFAHTRPEQPAPYMAAVPSVCDVLASSEPY